MPIASNIDVSSVNMNGGNPGSSPDSAGSGSGVQIPQALQNLQRLLQSQLANINPLQLQQALQRQQVNKTLNNTRSNFKGIDFHCYLT